MKGKTLNKKKIIATLMVVMGFVLTIVLTASVTLAWFYDSDWANKTVTMAGTVGIEMRNDAGTVTHGAGKFHFKISSDRAYPGQAVQVQSSVFNNGGTSIENHFGATAYDDDAIKNAGANQVGSSAYIRARFVVYTNIGTTATGTELPAKIEKPTAPAALPSGATAEQIEAHNAALATYHETLDRYYEIETLHQEYNDSKKLNATALYAELIKLVKEQNTNSATYDWVFWQNDDARMKVGNNSEDVATYFEGAVTSSSEAKPDGGYFYLCEEGTNKLAELKVGHAAAFLWNGTMVMPWQLTNIAADKTIFVALEFQAIQTYIPKMKTDTGVIDSTFNTATGNQLEASKCIVQDRSVQTVFNSSRFTSMSLLCTYGGIDYSTTVGFEKATAPATSDTIYKHGNVVNNTGVYPAT